jgi:DNA end-binding protein Ku
MVDRSEIEKGYEYEKGQYLLFTPKELEEIEPDSARTMEILEFVKLAEIDPLYFDASYYIAPDDGGAKPYNLLLDAMKTSGYAGIAKLTMHGRENIVIIRPRKNGLTLHTMFYANEIRSADEFTGGDKSEVKEAEKKLATQLVQTLAAKFEPEKYHEAYQQEMEKLIEAKAHGKQLAVVPHSVASPSIDLMAALKKSIEAKPASKTLLKAVPETPAKKRKAS